MGCGRFDLELLGMVGLVYGRFAPLLLGCQMEVCRGEWVRGTRGR